MERSEDDKRVIRALYDLVIRVYGLEDGKDLSREQFEEAFEGKPEFEVAVQALKVFLPEVIRETPKPPIWKKP